MTGKAKFEAVAKKLKNEVVTKQKEEVKIMTEIKNELATIQQDSELSKMYHESSQLGADNLSGETPLLKIYTANKTKNAILENGKRPTDGYFYHKPTQKEFENVTVHILTISRGFRAEGMVDKTGKKGDPKFNQVMGGLIIDEGKLLPFVMYFTGMKLQNLWDFGKEAGNYTKGKLGLPIPMFAMKVKLIPESVESNFGPVWIVKFEIVKDESGKPELILDPMLFSRIRNAVGKMEDMIASIIDAKSTEERIEEVHEVGEEGVEERKELPEPVTPDEIPF